MFKKSSAGLVVLTYLTGDVRAIKNRYRPIDGTVPWHKDISDPTWTTPDWPVDYPVPSYGALDQDMVNVAKSIKGSEKQLKKKLYASFSETDSKKDNYAANPRDYFVPDFGVDHDIKDVQKFIGDAEVKLDKKMTANFDSKADPLVPRNYFVPNFGNDPDMIDTSNSIAGSEARLKKKFTAGFDQTASAKGNYAANPRDYFVPNFGVDTDIKNVESAIKSEEKILKHEWKPKQDANGYWTGIPEAADNGSYKYNSGQYINNNGLVQIDSEVQDDPICSSAGCTQYKHAEKPTHPMDYPVANFGVDHDDVKVTENSEKIASKIVGHKWDFKEQKARDIVQYKTGPLDVDIQNSLGNLKAQESQKGIWELPPSNVQIESDVTVGDDPICSSAGCTQYKHAEKPTHPMDYFVPDFGVDKDITSSQSDEKIASKIVGHVWNWKEAPKAHPMNYVVPDFGVDEDIKNVQSAIKSEQTRLGVDWKPKQDANGFWTGIPEAADNSSYGYNQGQYINNSGLVQVDTEAQDDPICSSAGCEQYKHPEIETHPMDYFVPNFGQDIDIKNSIQDEKVASKLVGRKWNFPTGDSKWLNPAKDTDYNFAPELSVDSKAALSNLKEAESSLGQWNFGGLAQRKSDPICGSAGCPETKAEQEKEAKIIKYATGVPLDSDIKHTISNEALASDQVGHVWKM